MEYGAEKISKSEFLKYSGGEKIWNKLNKAKMKSKTKYTILKRTNNTIDINMETTSRNGRYKLYKIVFHDGNKKYCKYPKIAKFK